ncbi:MAG: hypothetical protein WAV55_08710 [Clostridiaceae bacterium]
MNKLLKIFASVSLLIALCGVFTTEFKPISTPDSTKQIVRNWDPGETPPIVIM